MRLGDKEFHTRGHLTDAERSEKFINEFEFSGCRNSLWSLLPIAIPDRSQWHRVHVSIELGNITTIRYGRTAIGRSMKMSAEGSTCDLNCFAASDAYTLKFRARSLDTE